MTRITIPITESERNALRLLAKDELRDARMQAAFILRKELERRGLLDSESAVKISTEAAQNER